jgi:protein tyrosine/serine phosphatase
VKKKSPVRTILTIAIVVCAVVLLVRNFRIGDFVIVRPGFLYISAQPSGMDYNRLLYKYHIATIVNIRPVLEHQEKNWRNEEITWTKSNGVNYIEIPIEKKNYFPDPQVQQRFLEIMDKKQNLPVLLHGAGDDKRVAMLVAVWLEKSDGYSFEQTLDIVKKIIDDRDLTAKEMEFIRSLAK